jgi:ferredoxin
MWTKKREVEIQVLVLYKCEGSGSCAKSCPSSLFAPAAEGTARSSRQQQSERKRALQLEALDL